MNLLLIQTLIPDYRVPVFQSLAARLGSDFKVASEESRGLDLPTIFSGHFVPLRNKFILGRKLEVQAGIARYALSMDVVIFEMNPRIVTTWLLVLARKLRRKPCVLWGHAWPRSGPGGRSDILRNTMRGLGDVILVYTEAQASELRRKMPHKCILAAPNALYTREQLAKNLDEVVKLAEPRTNFIYVGRLDADKKPVLLLKAFIHAAPSLAPDCHLIFVGDGTERKAMEVAAAGAGLSERVIFKGHISGLEMLRALYATSIASVSPGYVGLSITQSFSCGVPMIIARDEPHAPEVEAAQEGVNCGWFESDSPESLAQSLLDFYGQRQSWGERSRSIIEDCASRYSVEHMTERMIEAAKLAFEGRGAFGKAS